MPAPDKIRSELEEEVHRFREHSATTTDECTVATMIAVSDPDVRELIARKAERYVFQGVRCPVRGTVLFRFECPPGMICLVPQSFLARVDFRSRRVLEIIDPVNPESLPTLQTASGAVFAALEAPLASNAEQSRRKITVTITNVVDRAIQVDGTDIPFSPGSSSVEALVNPGLHSLDWFVQSEPGTSFTLTLAGATVPITFTAVVSDAQRENGRFSFSVA